MCGSVVVIQRQVRRYCPHLCREATIRSGARQPASGPAYPCRAASAHTNASTPHEKRRRQAGCWLHSSAAGKMAVVTVAPPHGETAPNICISASLQSAQEGSMNLGSQVAALYMVDGPRSVEQETSPLWAQGLSGHSAGPPRCTQMEAGTRERRQTGRWYRDTSMLLLASWPSSLSLPRIVRWLAGPGSRLPGRPSRKEAKWKPSTRQTAREALKRTQAFFRRKGLSGPAARSASVGVESEATRGSSLSLLGVKTGACALALR